jgi:hypothetical protein
MYSFCESDKATKEATAINNNNSVALVREQTIPTERPLLVSEVSAICGKRCVA